MPLAERHAGLLAAWDFSRASEDWIMTMAAAGIGMRLQLARSLTFCLVLVADAILLRLRFQALE